VKKSKVPTVEDVKKVAGTNGLARYRINFPEGRSMDVELGVFRRASNFWYEHVEVIGKTVLRYDTDGNLVTKGAPRYENNFKLDVFLYGIGALKDGTTIVPV